eukprot:7386905-Prymnesium_polylepis.1
MPGEMRLAPAACGCRGALHRSQLAISSPQPVRPPSAITKLANRGPVVKLTRFVVLSVRHFH